MIKPHWELKHDWWMEDFRDLLEDIWAFKLMLRQVADEPIGDNVREIIKTLNKCLKIKAKAYEKIYGGRPNLITMRREVENEKKQ